MNRRVGQRRQHADLLAERHHGPGLVEEARALEHRGLDDHAVPHAAGEGAVLLGVLAPVDQGDLAQHERVHPPLGRGLHLAESLAHRVGAQHHVDDVGHLALHGALAVELAELHDRLVRLGEPPLALEQHRPQGERRRRRDHAVVRGGLPREQPEPLELVDDRLHPRHRHRRVAGDLADIGRRRREQQAVDRRVLVVQSDRLEHVRRLPSNGPWRIAAMASLRHHHSHVL